MRLHWLIPVALVLAGCGKTERSIDAELDADFAKGEVLMTCKSSSSGTCHALFLADGQPVTAQAAVGATAGATNVDDGADYCVDVSAPDPARCHPRPLVSGKQIVHKATVRS